MELTSKGKPEIKWLEEPEAHDYAAARSYLALVGMSFGYSDKLPDCPVRTFKAKDIIRAAGYPLLGETNYHVKKDLDKIKAGKSISPLLLVADPTLHRLVIADGYHRACACYHYDEDSDVCAKLVNY